MRADGVRSLATRDGIYYTTINTYGQGAIALNGMCSLVRCDAMKRMRRCAAASKGASLLALRPIGYNRHDLR